MNEYSFDAMIDVEAESEEAAIAMILAHCSEANIAVSLHKAGSLGKHG